METSKSVFYNRLKSLCQERGITLSKVGDEAGVKISSATLTRWRDGVMPRPTTLKALADCFKVDIAYLLGTEDSPSASHTSLDCGACACKDNCKCSLSSQEHQLIKMFREASELGKMRMIKALMDVWEQDQ